MKKIIGITVLCFMLAISWRVYNHTSAENVTQTDTTDKKTAQYNADSSPTESTFVTYWSLGADASLAEYDEVYYFGVEANMNGIHQGEDGYRRIPQFMEKTHIVPSRFLVIRMVDKDVNSEVLKSRTAQELIATEAVEVANEYGFDGVVLDFETSSIGFDSVTNRVSNFYSLFADEVKKNNLLFYVTLYGDTYYRVRAYDVKHIAELSDKVLVMTYDFHKSRGNPGPNFPLRGKNTYGYDLTQMVHDFQKDIPTGKISIIFGMFGYDWEVDDSQKATSNGAASSYLKIQQSYIQSCAYAECQWEHDSESSETKVTYKDDEDVLHTIWFESPDSVEKKRAYLKSVGIEDIAYWAYSYY